MQKTSADTLKRGEISVHKNRRQTAFVPNLARHLLCVPGGMAEHRSGADLNKLTELIIGAAIEVHREQGAGLLESAYLPPLEAALRVRRLAVEKESAIKRPALRPFAKRYRADLVVEESVVVEVKAVDRILPVHAAQLRTYLRLSGCRVGLILNFNTAVLKDGIKRVVNDFPD